MKITEKVNPFILNHIIDNFESITSNSKYTEEYKPQLLRQLKTYRQKAGKNKKVDVEYNYKGVAGKGRLYTKGASLQTFPREIRNTLAQKNYIDIDIENCVFSILKTYCDNNNLPTQSITDYIENREERLKEIQEKFNINKAEAKMEMIKLTNSIPNKELLTFMKNIISEVKCFVLHIENNDKEFIEDMKLMKINKSSKTNDYASISTFYYQRIERQIIEEAVKYLGSFNYNVGCIIHDGFLLEKQNIKLDTLNATLKHLNQHIKKELKYDVKFTHKEFSETLSIPDEVINMNTETSAKNQKSEYELLKSKFESQYFKTLNPPCYINFDIDGYLHRTKIKEITTNFIDWKEAGTQKFDIFTDKPKTFIENYVRDPNKKIYDKTGFYVDRSKCPDSVFNIFKGFDFEEYYPNQNIEFTEEDYKGFETIKEFYNYILDDNSENVKGYYDYLIQFFSHIIFNPSIKTKIHIVLKSGEGNGKNLAFEFIGKELLGSKYYMETVNPRQEIFGDFNSIREQKKLICLNEAEPEETKYFYEKLKDSTTNETIIIKRKYFPDCEVRTYDEMVSTTNNEIPIKISETNRRFVLFECNQEKRDFEYYGKLFYDKNSYMKNKNCKILFLDYLKSKYDPDFNFSLFPKSRFYMRSLEFSKNNFNEYIKYIGGYFDNNQKLDGFFIKKGRIEVLQSVMYKNYEMFIKTNQFGELKTLKGFRLDLEKTQLIEFKHSNKGKKIVFDKEKFIQFLKSKNLYEKMEFLDSESEEDEE